MGRETKLLAQLRGVAASGSLALAGLIAAAALGLAAFEARPVRALAATPHPSLDAHVADGRAAGLPVTALPAPEGPALTVRPLSADDALAIPPIAAASMVGPAPRLQRTERRLQCAIYARERTGVTLTGAARSWWAKADGRYRRMSRPEIGAIVVMDGTASGHVAVVTAIVSDRHVLIDHANWLGQGEIITGAPMVDVSAAGDWSAVRVWHPPSDSLGQRAYPVLGFIAPEPPDPVEEG